MPNELSTIETKQTYSIAQKKKLCFYCRMMLLAVVAVDCIVLHCWGNLGH